MRFIIIKTALLLSIFTPLFGVGQEAELTKARNLAENGKFTEAIQVYTSVLNTNKENISALIGRGFTYSWNQDFTNASNDFTSVLQKDKNNMDAKKGMAYIALWSEDYTTATRLFDELITTYPNQKEFHIALGQALLHHGQIKAARETLEKAKKLDPSDQEIQQLIYEIRSKPAILEIDMIGGVSIIDDLSKGGLRLARISSQITSQLQLAVKYDNSLSLDNRNLLSTDRTIPYYAGSAYMQWNKHTATYAEIGTRQYADNKPGQLSNETQLELSQVFFLKNNTAFKFGAVLITPDVGENAYLLMGSYHQSISKQFSGGMTYFYADRNIFNTTENRFLIDADYYVGKGSTINGGFYYGKSNSDMTALSGNIYGGYLKGYFPVSNTIGINLMMAVENNFLQDLFNAGAGIRFRLEK